jgi:hypothetical protein
VSEFIGKMVRLRNGKICGPIKIREELAGRYLITDGVYTWTKEGRNTINVENDYDIVSVVDDRRFTPFYDPKLTETITRTGQGVIRNHPFKVDTDGVVLTDNPSFGRIYLAGPMAGYPERNYPAFMRAAKALRDLGYEVYNPAEYEANERFKGQEDRSEFPLREAFTEYTNYILNRADIIALLPGYENSVGATAELSLARVVKLKEIYL